MVLRILVLVVLATGCKQSLFEAKSDDTGTGDDTGSDGGAGSDAMVTTSCEAPCVGDAGGEFDGTAGGSTGHWRYLDDLRNRTWTPMTAGSPMTGMGSNKIAKCDGTNGGAACAELPDALLFTSSGATGMADPALELTVPDKKVIKYSLNVRVPSDGKAQAVRLYRSSREDALYFGTAMPGATLALTMQIDALKDERLLFALAPIGPGTSDVAVQVFVSDTEMAFPSNCELAIVFDNGVNGSHVTNECGVAPVISKDDNVDPVVEVMPTLAAGPFPELGMGESFVEGRHLDTEVKATRSGDWTVQFWWKFTEITSLPAFAFSDADYDTGAEGGLIVDVYQDAGLHLESVVRVPGDMGIADGTVIQDDGAWRFIRVVQQGPKVITCLDGKKAWDFDLLVGKASSNYPIRIGRNSAFNPQESLLGGVMDDIRVFKGVALPCE